jgi:hypothetical protein
MIKLYDSALSPTPCPPPPRKGEGMPKAIALPLDGARR